MRDEVVEDDGCEQRRVAAGDPGADRGERRVELAVARADEEPEPDGGRGDGGAKENALDRSDPTAVDREHEEEDDAEQHHDSAGDRERARAHQVGRLDSRQRDAAGALPLLPGLRRGRPRRRRPRRRRAFRHGLGQRRRLLDDGGRAGKRPELVDLALQRVQLALDGVESVLDGGHVSSRGSS
jgi:hypothetical protein